MAPHVYCGVILFEVCDNPEQGDVPNVSFSSRKYREPLTGSGGDLKFGRGTKTQTRGLRVPTKYSVETVFLKGADVSLERHSDGGSSIQRASKTINPDHPKKIYFYSRRSFLEIRKGIIHLYKENETTNLDFEVNGELPAGPSEMLGMFSIPFYISTQALLQLLAPFQKDLDYIQVVRELNPSHYMALLKCTSEIAAVNVYKYMNRRSYNSAEQGCIMAFLSRVEAMWDNEGVGLPLVGHTEMPSCPMCLKRMDKSVDGILPIFRNHKLHSAYLSEWDDSRCHVCRYVDTPGLIENKTCCECGSSESVWICLICGHVGCDFYLAGHSYKHFCETSHCYAVKPDDNRVYDYAGGDFVHQLVRGQPGKLDEVKSRQIISDASHEDIGHLKVELTNTIKQRDRFKEKLIVVNEKLRRVSAQLKEEKDLNRHLKSDQVKWSELTKNLEKNLQILKSEKNKVIDKLTEMLRDVIFFMKAETANLEFPLQEEIKGGRKGMEGSSKSPSTSKGVEKE